MSYDSYDISSFVDCYIAIDVLAHFTFQVVAQSLRDSPGCVDISPPYYNIMKQFSETELVIYGPVRVGAMDRLKCTTTKRSK